MPPTIITYQGNTPSIHETAFVADHAVLVGRVTLRQHASVWFHSVLRADINRIDVGEYSNIQDGGVLHVGDDFPCVVGSYVTAGHGVRIHGCTVEDNCLIGIGAIILNGARIGSHSIVGAGSVVTEGADIPPYSLVLGVPGKVAKTLGPDQEDKIRYWAQKYARVKDTYLDL
jgi:carbonic anhydrase/acetyltransferase-like protein (isoleucine patch superfamily)